MEEQEPFSYRLPLLNTTDQRMVKGRSAQLCLYKKYLTIEFDFVAEQKVDEDDKLNNPGGNDDLWATVDIKNGFFMEATAIGYLGRFYVLTEQKWSVEISSHSGSLSIYFKNFESADRVYKALLLWKTQ
jgi:hypothetical protein